ncbi:aminotransferase class V-fold PLP-dependent enzyme [Candidatus Oleimmundimicrobium sp.]|uniref:aminotransferase class V-fold PLP-dependent enzyme n=1 Tax=Candidatus Oleimmundimicrobium sp. TaxID=3060597 RepID=UPI002728AD2B|nr:aminotransferase class V-fold PLP-dependent enzyme [Candidatus Oleimmundimicrobium sp.]MDO8886454.1 aminotransferase class V-fold PLP-dependent enzyme [Candidatus Oleimmundimicrobium sp.]
MKKPGLIYFDNAATSYPKPPATLEACKYFTNKVGANPGRSGHRLSVEAGRILYDARASVAELFNIEDPLQIIFTYNATYALNMALFGLLNPGDHVITSSIEHNSIARPLRHLESQGVELTRISVDSKTCQIDPCDFKKAIKPNTKLIAILHGSNVTGAILPVAEIGKITREDNVLFLVDSAQTAGVYPIDVEAMNIDLLAFTGHKSLFGIQGTGGLYVREGVNVRPLIRGGTGSKSEEDIQPDFMPDCLESGTPNTPGLTALTAGVKFVLAEGILKIRSHEEALIKQLVDGLSAIDGVNLIGDMTLDCRLPVVSFNVSGLLSSEVGQILDEKYDIMIRVGLHCAPWAHQTMGTYPKGTVRVSLSYLNKSDEVKYFLNAVNEISEKRRT